MTDINHRSQVEAIRLDIEKLGVEPGDHVVVRTGLKALGVDNPAETLIEALLQAVGPTGSVYGLAFTKSFPLPLSAEHQKYVFERDTPAETGGLNNYMLSRKGSHRSSHPTMSFVGLNDYSAEILSQHTGDKAAFEPVRLLAQDPKGKMLLIGVHDNSPGMSTVHVAQHLLGFHNAGEGRYGVRYRRPDGEIDLYVRNYGAGCSRGFGRFYHAYRAGNAVTEGLVGKGTAMLGRLDMCLKIDMAIMSREPTYFMCDDLGCRSCRRDWSVYREPAMSFYPHFFLDKLDSALKRIVKKLPTPIAKRLSARIVLK